MTEPRQPFDPAVRHLLDEQSAAAPPLPSSNQALVSMARGLLNRQLENRASINGLPNQVETRNLQLNPGLAARLYLPPRVDQGQPLPVLTYLHGGGWVVGSVAVVDPFCRLLCHAAHVALVSVEYRLAPEHPHPAAVEDALTAVSWVAAHAQEFGACATRLALGGDSAGANLAAVAANWICAQTQPIGLQALMLLYPVTDHPDAGHASYVENARGYGLEAERMRWFWQQYASHVSPTDPGISPLQCKHPPPLPPTLVTTAEYDVLRDEGVAYAQKLSAAGVKVTHWHAPDMGHNFPVTPNLVGRFPQSDRALADIAGWLRTALAPAQS